MSQVVSADPALISGHIDMEFNLESGSVGKILSSLRTGSVLISDHPDVEFNLESRCVA